MSGETLLALAERCEKASGPDRALDHEVASALGMCLHPRQTKNGCQGDWGYDCDDCGADSWGNRSKDGFNRRLNDPTPAYTASVDAAMTLVPNDCAPSVMRCHDGVGRADAHQERTGRMFYAGAATPALALCAAALRARAHQETSNVG